MSTRELLRAMTGVRARSLAEALGCLLWTVCPDPGQSREASAETMEQYAEYLDRAQREDELAGELPGALPEVGEAGALRG